MSDIKEIKNVETFVITMMSENNISAIENIIEDYRAGFISATETFLSISQIANEAHKDIGTFVNMLWKCAGEDGE